MSDIGKTALKNKIDAKIYDNESQLITGTILNEVLQDAVDTLADGGNLDAGSVDTANLNDEAVTKGKLAQNVSADLDWAVASNSYYRNSQAGDVAAKVITTYKNMNLIGGGSLKVTFEQANTADDATLNIDGKGAKPLYYNGARVSSTNSWEANETVEIYYNNYNSGIYYAKRWMVEPVSVSQNTQIGGINLKIGNEQYNIARQNEITMENIEDSSSNDLSIGDEDGDVLCRFKRGDLQTKNFDSSETPSIKDIEKDFAIGDKEGNALLILDGGELETKNFDSSKTPSEGGGVDCDLAIIDKNKNAIVVLKGGHIKTKYFDSSLLTTKFLGKKIGIIGDSISTYSGWLPSDIQGYDGAQYAAYYPQGNVNSPSKTWWYKLALMMGLNPNTDISNCAWSGSKVSGNSSSTTNATAGCSTRRVNDLSLRFGGNAPDIIITYIGCNDWGVTPNIPIGTWAITDAIPSDGTITELRAAYALMLNKIHTAYPNARVFCCTNLDDMARDATPGWPSNNASGVSTYEYNENITEVAHALGCDVINLHRCGINYSNITNYVVDAGLHPNDAGHTLMAKKIFTELVAKY